VRPPLVVGAFERLAVDGDDATLGQRRDQSGDQRAERSIERLRVDQAEHGRERVVRWHAVLELQEALEKPELCASELGHLRAVLGAAQHGQKGNDQDLGQIVARVLGARVGDALERGKEKLHREAPWSSRESLKNP